MAFKVTKADGTVLIVDDYSKAVVGGLTLLGYGFANYSDEMAQNFVNQLENNAGYAEPSNPVLGQFWFQLPTDVSTGSKLLRICVSTTASTLDARWKNLFVVDASGNVLLDAWTLRGAAPSVGGGSAAQAGQVVIRNANGKIDSSNIDFPSAPGSVDHASNADSATKLANARTFGSRNGGIAFDGTQNVPLTTAHIAEGDQAYFTQARARQSISASGAISYDPNTGIITYNPPAASAAVNHFNGRTGDVTLNGTDVVNALGYTPVNKNGDTMNGSLTIQGGGGLISLGSNGDITAQRGNSSGVIFLGNTGARYVYYDGTNYQMPGAWLYVNGGFVWNSNHQGSGSGMDADMVDGHHYADIINDARSGSGGITAQGTGWVKFSNGLLMQYGFQYCNGNGYTFWNFPTAFASKPSLLISGTNNISTDAHDNSADTVDSQTTATRAGVYNANDNAGIYHWFAIGY